MNILFIHQASPHTNSATKWRGFSFAAAIQRTNRHQSALLEFADFVHDTVQAHDLCMAADLIVLQGESIGSHLGTLQHWKARDKIIVVDVDAGSCPQMAAQAEQRPWSGAATDQERFCWALRLVDATIVPSRQMVEVLSAYTRAVWVPDYIDLDRYLTVHPVAHQEIVVGFPLSPENRQGLIDCGLIAGLKRVCQARPAIEIVAWNDRREEADYGLLGETGWIGTHPIDNWIWPHPLAYVDIGLAPLTQVSDLSRGWNDVLEYMVMRIPWLASHGPAYYDLRSFGWLVHNNPGSWERVLLDMVDHMLAYKSEAAGEPYLYGIGQGIDENVENLLTVYSEIYRNSTRAEVRTYAAE